MRSSIVVLASLCLVAQFACGELIHGPMSWLSNFYSPSQQSSNSGSSSSSSSSSSSNWSSANTLSSLGQTLHNGYQQLDSGYHNIRTRFEQFLTAYGKNYPLQEIPRRLSLFARSLQIVQDSWRGNQSYALELNEFSDWDDHELRALNGVKMGLKQLHEINATLARPSAVRVRATETIPSFKDWRKSGCLSTPISQDQCGCCWAVSSLGVVEAQNCLINGAGSRLSIQQLIDCSTPSTGYRNDGCNGGWPTEALNYIFRGTETLAREVCYPFKERRQTCQARAMSQRAGCTVSRSSMGLRGFKILKGEDEILYHVAKTGPVVAVIQATQRFILYGRGIFDDPSCRRRPTDVDHGIAIVGYGRENNEDYWIIKNSWGTSWGQGGYGRVRRGKNACSIGHIGWVVL
ncbi:Thiol protease aleurain [Fragariocoptes setiger]|uniref:Thiol protease aleurain n=1 Tax=Fragariocoptes setiger TaxID=1670756 RepID=A0ABQ7S830_9ACAR|nr:Thiol protease aleurain [Fragariocoptes setiger]